jgi:glycine cleavage system aminomethyltransferase T
VTALSFLQPDAAGAPPARSPIADASGARTELRDGWEVATSFGDPEAERRAVAETVGVADLSHLAKLELQGPLSHELGVGVVRGGAWHLPVTPTRALVVGEPAEVLQLRDAPPPGVHALDVTTTFAALALAGPLARETFARFCALDLREAVLPLGGFRPGSVARTPGFVLRESTDRFLVLFGAAYGEYLWEVVLDAANHLGGRAVGVDVVSGVTAHA